MAAPSEAAIRDCARELYVRASRHPPELYRGVMGQLLTRAMADERLRAGLFQFVDTLPRLRDAAQIRRHLEAYLGHGPAEEVLGQLLRWSPDWALDGAIRWQVHRLARHFLAEEGGGLATTLEQVARLPAQVTVDAVGEAVLTEAEAQAYLERNLRLLDALAARGCPDLSIKLTALTPRADSLDLAGTRERIFRRLEPLMARLITTRGSLTVDMEHHELKPLVLQLFLDLLKAFPDPAWSPAIALQAYLPETDADLVQVRQAAARRGRRLGVRLVKGAYWEQEQAWAAQHGWPVPTIAAKAGTDAHFEALTGELLGHCDELYPAIASHNLRSQAVALAWVRQLDLPASAWEAQMLFGMGEPLAQAVAAGGTRLRIYVPVGDTEIGMAYLIRRLLENTASTSILRQTYVEGADFEALAAPPRIEPVRAGEVGEARPARGEAEGFYGRSRAVSLPSLPPPDGSGVAAPGAFANLPLLDFSRPGEAEAFAAALGRVRASLPRRHVSGDGPRYQARNPARPEELLGEVSLHGPEAVAPALIKAQSTFSAWSASSVGERCAVLRRVATDLTARRRELAVLQVLEAGKNWREADADVAEAVDFLRYYAGQMERLAGWQETVHFPGETNHFAYAPRGPAVILAPWNFPLAILTGMSAAALVAGNPVVLKPALPGLLSAQALHQAWLTAGVPGDACQLLAGGPELGAALVADARTHIVAFTGSRAVGLAILQAAHTPAPGQSHVKQVVCEMGGKNAIIVDEDADLDEAVAGILASAFGYAGQKCSACSRVIAVGTAHDILLKRLADAADALAWGPPEDPAWAHGPLISEAARDKALSYIAIGREEGRLAWQGKVPEDGGWYVPPTIFAGIQAHHRLAREEVFGPVLAVLQAPDFAAALKLANASDYRLTGGVYSRYPPHLARAQAEFRVGNLYLNRKITGARVGVQPFGGVGLSGTGIQAGGPDYLKQFLWSRSVAANTMRHGFIPAPETTP
ncbi:MAG TPA: proline dehydrogenase family protein [Azospira sp.]|nr:proline dehydrogenase family protein [Azospira sp.]